MKVLVLGASGQIGSIIFEGLAARHEVVGTSRTFSGKFLRFDPFVDDWSGLGKLDVVINCIGQIVATKSFSFESIHVSTTRLILENRLTMGDPRIVQISALGASTSSDIDFLRTKGVADELLLRHADTFVVRPSIVCTPRTMIVQKLLMLAKMSRFTGGVLLLPKGFLATNVQPVMPVDLVDIVQLICRGEHTRVVDAVGPDRLSFFNLLHILHRSQNRKFKIVEVPKSFSDIFLGNGVPKLMNKQQYKLLFKDNVGEASVLEKLLERKLHSPIDFFKEEFTGAAN
jgi:uncharacterized protein YbjT (DUF2867 family)